MATHHELITRTIKALSLSAIEKAKSGHTSFPLGMADIGYALFFKQMNFNPKDAKWINRDRLVLSSGHGSMFLYSFLHLMAYRVSLDDLKQFRQIGSITAGHPEFGLMEGVECTTGPLGQGVANAVGMALSEAMAAARFNKEEKIIDHFIYCLCGDGDLMEGVAMEAISFAGHYQLSKLICIYDDNKITIDGKTNITYSENVKAKFEAQNWHVIEIDGHNLEEINQAIEAAKKEAKPSLIIAKTISGKGAVNWEGTNKIHGNPMTAEDYDASFKALGLDRFEVPNEAYALAKEKEKKLQAKYKQWQEKFEQWISKNPSLAEELNQILAMDYNRLESEIDSIELKENAATRSLNGQILNALSESCSNLIGGSADLAGSNNTTIKNSSFISATDFTGRNIHFGIREHAMGGIMNGIAYHGFFRPYGGTFLVFSDYMRPAVRLAALSHLATLYIWTHDSFYVGEDGPTHHPVEHISSLRLIPNLICFRPADGNELKSVWKFILREKKRPIALCLTRQNVKTINQESYEKPNAEKGAYILKDAEAELKFIIIASGSELSLAIEALEQSDHAKHTRLISMPSMELFNEQRDDYKNKILPKNVTKRLAIEAGRSDLWWKYIGLDGRCISKDDFSQSAPYQDLEKAFGFTVENLQRIMNEYFS